MLASALPPFIAAATQLDALAAHRAQLANEARAAAYASGLFAPTHHARAIISLESV